MSTSLPEKDGRSLAQSGSRIVRPAGRIITFQQAKYVRGGIIRGVGAPDFVKGEKSSACEIPSLHPALNSPYSIS